MERLLRVALMKPLMVSVAQHLEIFEPVVLLVAIDMVHMLVSCELASECFLHDEAVRLGAPDEHLGERVCRCSEREEDLGRHGLFLKSSA